jgi:hypothetical protein
MTARRLSKIAHSEPTVATAAKSRLKSPTKPWTFFNAARPNSQQLRSGKLKAPAQAPAFIVDCEQF